jgi:hypothetical protein
MPCTELLIRKSKLSITDWRERAHTALNDGQIRLKVEHFALTSNNLTYAVFGETMQYWGFYPVDERWGIIPVWGFATVEESATQEVKVGERFYGYYPMASHAVLQPARVSAQGFTEGSAHRAGLHGVYNYYTNTATDPLYTPTSEAIQALLRPLFFTSWLIDDFLADNDFFGAKVAPTKALVLLSSASSKTAFATAFQLSHRNDLELVGLTSPRNVEFCESLGLYSSVVSYGQITELAAERPCIYVDFSGDAQIRQTVHQHFYNLMHSSAIGGTHIENLGGADELPGPKPTLFFAPSQIKKRSQEWGAQELGQRLGAAWFAFTNRVGSANPPWIKVSHQQGQAPLVAAYLDLLGGKADAQTGFVMRLG